jgi:glycosyltransferase involved in cell wall biosynthesis
MPACLNTPSKPHIALIIPTLNEEDTIGAVVARVPRDWIDDIIIADGGSRDCTVDRAVAAGARVVHAGRGYGRACLAGATAAGTHCGILVFMDGDGSDRPELIPGLVGPIIEGQQDFVIGSRLRGERAPGSLLAHQMLAGRALGLAMGWRYGVRYTDMCAFRAVRRDALFALDMREMTYGWNLELQMRAARGGLRILEIPVGYDPRRGGASKVAGSLVGSLRASGRILITFVRVALETKQTVKHLRHERQDDGPIPVGGSKQRLSFNDLIGAIVARLRESLKA